jgi:hypothetical protein
MPPCFVCALPRCAIAVEKPWLATHETATLHAMPVCSPRPDDKRAFGKAVGDELMRRHGKKRYYPPKDVRDATRSLGYPLDWSCWGMSLFTSPSDFEMFHHAAGEACDYAAMKAEMFAAMTDGVSSSWFDIDMSWLEWPDIDLSSIFEVFDW